MHSPDDIHYALETTKVLHEPDRRIETFGYRLGSVGEVPDRDPDQPADGPTGEDQDRDIQTHDVPHRHQSRRGERPARR